MRAGLLAALVLLGASAASAQTSQTFEYDALGRLTKVTPSSGNAVTYAYDNVDNRTSVVAAAANLAPVAVDDVIYAMLDNAGDTYYWGQLWQTDVLANDYDPNPGDTFSLWGVSGNPYVTNPSGYIHYGGPIGSGHQVFYYTIKDASGATDTAKVDVYFYY